MAERLILLCEACERPDGVMQVQMERDARAGGVVISGFRCLGCNHVTPAWPTQAPRVVGKAAG